MSEREKNEIIKSQREQINNMILNNLTFEADTNFNATCWANMFVLVKATNEKRLAKLLCGG